MDRCGHRYHSAEALLHRQGVAAYGKARPDAWAGAGSWEREDGQPRAQY